MADSIYIKNLRPLDLTDMYITFLDAFSDYPIPFKLNKEQFVRKFVQKLKIDFNLSVGAFNYDGGMAGFIFSAVNYYDGKLTAYNGGTGVRPRYRGQRLTIQMYEYLRPILKERKIEQCVLEVLTSNQRAIKAYTNIGFRKTRFFKCYTLSNGSGILEKRASNNFTEEIFVVRNPNWDLYARFCDYQPSFLDSSRMIMDNLANETIIEAHIDDECVAYAIFQPSFGRISQIGIKPEMRRKGVASAMMNYIHQSSLQKKLTIINVNDEAEGTKGFFLTLGFDNQIDQFEMILDL